MGLFPQYVCPIYRFLSNSGSKKLEGESKDESFNQAFAAFPDQVFETSLNFILCILVRQRQGNNGFRLERLNMRSVAEKDLR